MSGTAASSLVIALPALRSAGPHEGCGDVPFHSHREMELVLVLSGAPRVHVGGGCLAAKPRELFILPANTPHDQECRGKWRTLCVLFANTGQVTDEMPRVLACGKERRIWRWIQELAALHRSNVPPVVADSFLLALLGEIGRFENDLKTTVALPPRLVRAVRFLEDHPCEEVDAATLARSVGVSYSRLGVLFRAHLKCAPLEYHRKLRMSFAKKLLLNPYASIDEVAAQAGFEDVNYFCRLFRKTYSVSPGKWRRESTLPPVAGK